MVQSFDGELAHDAAGEVAPSSVPVESPGSPRFASHPASSPRTERQALARGRVFLLGALEVVFLGALVAAASELRAWDGEAQLRAAAKVDPEFGWASLLILLIGSLGLRRAVKAGRFADKGGLSRALAGVVVCGMGFVALRASECVKVLCAGRTEALDAVFVVATAVPALHVVVAASLVAALLVRLLRGGAHGADPAHVRSGPWVEVGACATKLGVVALLWHVSVVLFLGVLAGIELGLANELRSSSTGVVVLAGALTATGATALVGFLARREVLHGAVLLFSMFFAFVSTAAIAMDEASRGIVRADALDRPADRAEPFASTRAGAKAKEKLHDVERAEGRLRAELEAARARAPARDSKGAGARAAVSAEVLLRATEIYETRCASCHGAKGKGDGPGAFAIKPPPRDYTDPGWQRNVTDEELAAAIARGGTAVGKSFMMPPLSPDLRKDPELVAGLVVLVRDFGSR